MADDVVALLEKKGSIGLFVKEMERSLSMTEKQAGSAIDRAREKYRAPICNVGKKQVCLFTKEVSLGNQT